MTGHAGFQKVEGVGEVAPVNLGCVRSDGSVPARGTIRSDAADATLCEFDTDEYRRRMWTREFSRPRAISSDRNGVGLRTGVPVDSRPRQELRSSGTTRGA